MNTYYIHLIRHGITAGNKNNWIYGGTDLPLLQEGKDALADLREQRIYPAFSNTEYWTTGMLRTKQTASILFGDQSYHHIPSLREINFGIYECHKFDDLIGDPVYDAWLHDKTGLIAPEKGESRRQFARRIKDGWEEFLTLRDTAFTHTTLVCHGGPIGMILLSQLGDIHPKTKEPLDQNEPMNMYYFLPEPGHGYTLTMKGRKVIGKVAF